MLAAPHSAVADIGFPALPPPAGANVLAVQAQLRASEAWPAERLVSQQRAQLARLLAHADRSVPMLRDRLNAAGWRGQGTAVEEIWDRLPPLERGELRAAGAAAFAAGVPASHGRVGDGTTSGSTGTPLTYRRTQAAQFLLDAQALRQLLWHGIDLGGTQAVLKRDLSGQSDGPEGRSKPDWGGHAAIAFPTGPSHHLDLLASIEQQLDWVEQRRPSMLVSQPSNLRALARACHAEGRRWPWLRSVHTIGEVVDEAVRETCLAAWGCDPIDAYSASEIGPIALQCPAGRYHLCAETVLVEVLDDTGRACRPGEVGRVVVTPLHNFAMPLLRYAIGDLAEVGEPCSCGRTLPVLTRILGRARDRLVLPSGERRYANTPHKAFAAQRAVRQYRIVQRSVDLVEVQLVADAPLSPEDEAALAAALEESFGHAFRFRFAYVDAIARAPSGKFIDIACEVPGAED